MEFSLRRIFISPSFLLLIFSLAIYTLGLNVLWATDHVTSFLELDWAIWHNHSFALAKVVQSLTSTCQGNPIKYGIGVVCTVDDFMHNGYYYSALAPGTAFLVLPLTIIGFLLDKGFNLYAQPLVYSEFVIALTNSVATVVVYKISKLYFKTPTSVFLALAYAFSTISWPFATFIFQSDPSAAFDLIAAYFALKVSRSGIFSNPLNSGLKLREILFCGLALSVASIIDYLNLILIPIFLFFMIYALHKQNNKEFAKDLIGFVLSALLCLTLIGAYNYVNFGNPLTTSEQLYDQGKGILALFPQGLDYGLFLNLISPYRGLFFYSPILVLGVLGFYKMLRSQSYDKEGIFILGLFCGILFPYSKWYLLDAGLSYGPRFIVPSIPFLLIPAGFLINEPKQRIARILAYALYSIGVVTNGIAAFTSALANTSNSWLKSPFLYGALPAYSRGIFDSWFFSTLPKENAWTLSILIFGLVLASPLLSYWLHARFGQNLNETNQFMHPENIELRSNTAGHLDRLIYE